MARISEVYLSTLSSIMSEHGLERAFYPLLYLCKHSGNVTQKDMSEALRKDKVSTMRTVDYLCEKGLVVRRPHESDRRCQLLEVTSEAIALQPKIEKAVKQTNDILLKNFTEDERVIFEKGMDKLYRVISTLPEPAFIIKAFKRDDE